MNRNKITIIFDKHTVPVINDKTKILSDSKLLNELLNRIINNIKFNKIIFTGNKGYKKKHSIKETLN